MVFALGSSPRILQNNKTATSKSSPGWGLSILTASLLLDEQVPSTSGGIALLDLELFQHLDLKKFRLRSRIDHPGVHAYGVGPADRRHFWLTLVCSQRSGSSRGLGRKAMRLNSSQRRETSWKRLFTERITSEASGI